MYKLPHELPGDLKLTKEGNLIKNVGKLIGNYNLSLCFGIS